MLAGFIAFFSAIPGLAQIGGYLRELGIAVAKWVEQAKKRAARERLEQGIDDAQTTGNSCELERAFDPDRKCDPPPSQL